MAFLLFRLPLLVLSQGATVVYPLYASYKAITAASRQHSSVSSYSWASSPRRPSQELGPDGIPVGGTTEMAELETWIMYWSIIGCMRVTETFAEWSWSWFPLYFEAKLLFSLWLVLPQTRGATYLYVTYLGPILATHEDDIDVAMGAAKVKAKKLGVDWADRAWQAIKSAVLGAMMSDAANNSNTTQSSSSTAPTAPPQPPNVQPGNASSQLTGFLKSYAPQALAGAAALLDSARAGARTEAVMTSRARAADAQAPSSRAVRTPMSRTESSVRRAQLERALAELDAASAAANREESATRSGYLHAPKRSTRSSGESGPGLEESFDMIDRVDVGSSSSASTSAPAQQPRHDADTSADQSWGSWLKRTASGGVTLSPRKKDQ